MTDNSTLKVASGSTEIFANKDIGGVKFPKFIRCDSSGVEIVPNANGPATPQASAPVVIADQYSKYKVIPENSFGLNLGTTGAIGDYLATLLLFPLLSSGGQLFLYDGNKLMGQFVGGGTIRLVDMKPILISVEAFSVIGAWNVILFSGATGLAIGKFT